MKPERRVEKFLRRIDVIPNAERKRLKLEELLEVRDKTKKSKSADVRPTIRRLIMNRQIWKIAASLLIVATSIGVIEILQNGSQTAYAFEQTVAAMQAKRSFHIRTYHGSPTWVKDEYWVEFDEHGQVIHLRQVEWLGRRVREVEVIWENGIKYQYELDDKRGEPGILLISKKEHHVDEEDLEEFDPEMILEEFYKHVKNGQATIKIDGPLTPGGNLVVKVTEVTQNESPWRRVLLVDPETKFLVRMDTYWQDDEGSKNYNGIEVLGYNQPFDPNLFKPNFPADTIIVDQTSGNVGMAQGDLSNEKVAYEVVRKALEAWAADDYEAAGLFFGGAPKEFFMQRASDKPKGDIVIEEPEICMLEPNRSRYRVKCGYLVEEGDQLKTNRVQYFVTTVAGQPGRWFITPIKL